MLDKWGLRRAGRFRPTLPIADRKTPDMTDDAAPAPDWTGIREAYEERRLKVTEIARKFGVAQATIYRRIDEEDWERRHAGATWTKRRAMLRRLGKLVSRELTALEESAQAADEEASLADRERLAKVAAGLVKLMESIAALEAELERTRQAARASAERTGDDDDTLRHRIAQRIIALCSEAPPETDAGPAGPQ